MLFGISISGYIIGIVWCGDPNCIFCIINGIVGIFYVISGSVTISIALHNRYKSKYTTMTVAHSCCTFFFTIMMFITFGTMGTRGSCNFVIEYGLMAIFFIPFYICLTVKLVSDCASSSN